MISKSVCTSAKDAVKYFEDHLNVADYFVKGEKMDRGQFIGKVAQRLGVDGKPVTRDAFIAFTECDMKALGAQSGRQRTSEIKYTEFTYSAPKAVSVVAALDDRVKGELFAAVKEEMKWFEKLVAVRDRRGDLADQEVTKPTGKMIAAVFQHETSRSNDPDFHVHALIGNVTWDEERQGYFAVHYGQMLELRKTLDARIHNNLAGRMRDLGYHIEVAPAGFGLKEVPAQALDLFSERGRQVRTAKMLLQQGYGTGQIAQGLKGLSDEQKRQLLATPDRLKERLGKPEGQPSLKPDHRMDQMAVTLTRPKKVRITSETLRDDVGRRLREAGLNVEMPAPYPVKGDLDLNAALRQGTEIAFDKKSVVRLDHLLGEIVRLAPGQILNERLAESLRDNRRFLARRKDNQEFITTRRILSEEKTLLTSVVRGMGKHKPLQNNYSPPAALVATSERIAEIVKQAARRGEELKPAQAKQWLNQFSAIHRYVSTSEDRFLNVRGGAGTGKTFCLEQLIDQSQQAGRPVFICAPYGEQARLTLRQEASRIEASGSLQVARIFEQADTVDALLVRTRREPDLLRGADIYIDEAGLLDTRKALALVQEAERAEARVIFQGDTAQLPAVGRGEPIKLLQDELGLGMDVPRASISRRQLSSADKELAADLSSGNEEKFLRAVHRMVDREMIRETPPSRAVEIVAKEIVEARSKGKEVVAVSSVHRICDALADRVHDIHLEKNGRNGQTTLDVHIKRPLSPAELGSSAFYRIGQIVEYKKGDAVIRAPVISVLPDGVKVERDASKSQIPFRRVRAVFDLSRIERGPGERLLLQDKVKQNGRVYEKNSRHIVLRIVGSTVHFTSGLKLSVNDGRIRQGDVLTDYKSQGVKGVEVRGVEDNSSVAAMATKESFHVKGTRHVQSLVLHVESKGLYLEAIQRSNVQFSASQFERLPDSRHELKRPVPPRLDRGNLFMKARTWGREFRARIGGKPTELVRNRRLRFEQMRQRLWNFMRETTNVREKAESSGLTHAMKNSSRKQGEMQGPKLTSALEVITQNQLSATTGLEPGFRR